MKLRTVASWSKVPITPLFLMLVVVLVALNLPIATGLSLRRTLALLTDSDAVPSNTFTTAASFGGCSTGNTGFKDPTTEAADTGGDRDGFELNPTNAFADDAPYASNINGRDDRHRFYGYDFSLGSDCTIEGIELRLDWWLDSISGTSSMDVELSWDGGVTWTGSRNDALETATEHTVTFGGPTDIWGHAWTVSELNSTNFRARLISISTANTRDFFVDWVSVKVYHGPSVSDTGYLSPTAEVADTGGDGDGFEANPTNAFADDVAFASNINNSGDRHQYYNNGASIPAGSTINGVEVRVDWWMDDVLGTNSMDIELSWDGGTSWTTAKSDTTATTTEHTFSLGGPADTWGRTWGASEFNDSNFRIRLNPTSSSGFRDFYLDWVPVKVYYTGP